MTSRGRQHRAGRFVALTLAAVAWVMAAGPVRAHPHVWIDLKSRAVLDDAGRLAAVSVTWRFDPAYSAYTIADMTGGVSLPPAEMNDLLSAMATDTIRSLGSFDYFTQVTLDGGKVPLAAVETFDTGVADGRIWLRFSVPLADPLPVGDGGVAYAVFDPFYYIEILHESPDAASVEGPCETRIVAPRPTAEAVAIAAAMDQAARGDPQLGSVFAERVRLVCQ